ncbi:MAG: hypothetical protein GY847_22385 [Proteobacteria bacterium]|nr:hypothetical protein [Pseudomonadota bacterium]
MMKWIALKGQNVMRNGKKVRVEPGEDLPEAENFPQRDEVWVKAGFIKQVFCATPVKDEEPKQKRTRRTRAQIEADNAKAAEAAKPVAGVNFEVE